MSNKRITIKLSEALDEDLNWIINNSRGDIASKGNALRNAIVIYKILLREKHDGNKIVITNGDDDKIIKELGIIY